MLSSSIRNQYEEVEVSKVFEVSAEEMKPKGYNYVQVVVETPYTTTVVTDAKVYYSSVDVFGRYFFPQPMVKLDVESNNGSVTLNSVKVNSFFVKKSAPFTDFMLQCEHDVNVIISYSTAPMYEQQEEPKEETNHNIYSDCVNVRFEDDEDGELFTVYVDNYDEVTLTDQSGDHTYEQFSINEMLQRENELYSDFNDGWTEAYHYIDEGDTDTLMERVFEELGVVWVSNC